MFHFTGRNADWRWGPHWAPLEGPRRRNLMRSSAPCSLQTQDFKYVLLPECPSVDGWLLAHLGGIHACVQAHLCTPCGLCSLAGAPLPRPYLPEPSELGSSSPSLPSCAVPPTSLPGTLLSPAGLAAKHLSPRRASWATVHVCPACGGLCSGEPLRLLPKGLPFNKERDT